MPKVTKYPRLRTRVYKGKSGQAWVYYSYDMRPDGKPDVRLGTDYAEAIRQWDDLHNHRPRTVGLLAEAFDKWREIKLPAYESKETRSGYTRNLNNIAPVFGQMTWDQVTLPMLIQYLDKRSAKTQGNREMSVLQIVWGWALKWGMTQKSWPAAGIKDWKNKESAREFEVTDDIFNAVYECASPMLRDCMDIASATGMRLTDARTCRMPIDGKIRFKANKTGKWSYFDVSESPVLSAVIERRGNASSVVILVGAGGRSVTQRTLRSHYDLAREKAAGEARKRGQSALAVQIEAMYLRDMRKRASDLAEGMDAATELLQHSDSKVTAAHYRTKATKLKAVR